MQTAHGFISCSPTGGIYVILCLRACLDVYRVCVWWVGGWSTRTLKMGAGSGLSLSTAQMDMWLPGWGRVPTEWPGVVPGMPWGTYPAAGAPGLPSLPAPALAEPRGQTQLLPTVPVLRHLEQRTAPALLPG